VWVVVVFNVCMVAG